MCEASAQQLNAASASAARSLRRVGSVGAADVAGEVHRAVIVVILAVVAVGAVRIALGRVRCRQAPRIVEILEAIVIVVEPVRARRLLALPGSAFFGFSGYVQADGRNVLYVQFDDPALAADFGAIAIPAEPLDTTAAPEQRAAS